MTTEIARPADAQAAPKTIKLRTDKFAKVAALNGWTSNAAIARAIGVSETQVARVIRGEADPGTQFIAGFLAAAEEVGFRRVFEIVPMSIPNTQEVT